MKKETDGERVEKEAEEQKRKAYELRIGEALRNFYYYYAQGDIDVGRVGLNITKLDRHRYKFTWKENDYIFYREKSWFFSDEKYELCLGDKIVFRAKTIDGSINSPDYIGTFLDGRWVQDIKELEQQVEKEYWRKHEERLSKYREHPEVIRERKENFGVK